MLRYPKKVNDLADEWRETGCSLEYLASQWLDAKAVLKILLESMDKLAGDTYVPFHGEDAVAMNEHAKETLKEIERILN